MTTDCHPFPMPASLIPVKQAGRRPAIRFLLSLRSLAMALTIKRKRIQHPQISLQLMTLVWRKCLAVKFYNLISSLFKDPSSVKR